eukprot:CAMPEP_0169111028 /NCGR_PEP_ID=MMETSP1015-20121227/26842_1 /TAXON_ID=342587 /ORGANISM="Karlodinium micrum, Strain CCMP2283" /LENGTH=98 /DNA_ID=CAMNT_0009172889 /DNA_START=76 /DNA_END=372 /DNA_ORIENTATION=+
MKSLHKVPSHEVLDQRHEDDMNALHERFEDGSSLHSSASNASPYRTKMRLGLGKMKLASCSDLTSMVANENYPQDKEEQRVQPRRSRRDYFDEDVVHW